jgi:hypothetical protein
VFTRWRGVALPHTILFQYASKQIEQNKKSHVTQLGYMTGEPIIQNQINVFGAYNYYGK